MSAVLFVIVYLLRSFWFYGFDPDCILVVLFGICYFYPRVLKFLSIRICWISLIKYRIYFIFCFFPIATTFNRTLHVAFSLTGMFPATATIWKKRKHSYSYFRMSPVVFYLAFSNEVTHGCVNMVLTITPPEAPKRNLPSIFV